MLDDELYKSQGNNEQQSNEPFVWTRDAGRIYLDDLKKISEQESSFEPTKNKEFVFFKKVTPGVIASIQGASLGALPLWYQFYSSSEKIRNNLLYGIPKIKETPELHRIYNSREFMSALRFQPLYPIFFGLSTHLAKEEYGFMKNLGIVSSIGVLSTPFVSIIDKINYVLTENPSTGGGFQYLKSHLHKNGVLSFLRNTPSFIPKTIAYVPGILLFYPELYNKLNGIPLIKDYSKISSLFTHIISAGTVAFVCSLVNVPSDLTHIARRLPQYKDLSMLKCMKTIINTHGSQILWCGLGFRTIGLTVDFLMLHTLFTIIHKNI
jgi:hypothetical protein